MIYDYLITLKKRDYKFVDQISQLMYIFALAIFCYFYYQHPKTGAIYLYIGGGVIAAWIYAAIKKSRKGEAFFRLGLLIAAVGWFLGPERNILMAILYAVAGIMERQVKFPQEVGFSEEQISFNTLPARSLQWNQVQNVLIKDGILTIDMKSNKIFQKEIEGYVTKDIEKEFNDFCGKCLQASNKQDLSSNQS